MKNLILLIIVFNIYVSMVLGQNKLVIRDGFEKATFEEKMYIFENNKGINGIEEIKNIPHKKFEIMKGFSYNFSNRNSEYWVKFYIQNLAAEPKSLILQIRKSFVDSVNVYKVSNMGTFCLGNYNWRQSYIQRPFPSFTISYPLELEPFEDAIVYLKMHKKYGSWHIVPDIFSKKYYVGVDYSSTLIQLGLFLGIFVFSVISVLIFYILTKKRVFLFYFFYQIFFILLFLTTTEVLYYFFGRNFPEILVGEIATPLYEFLVLWAYLTFNISFFYSGLQKTKIFFNSIKIVQLILILSIFLYSLSSRGLFIQKWFQYYLLLSAVVVILLSLIVQFVGLRFRMLGANQLVLAQSPFILSCIFWVISNITSFYKPSFYSFIFSVSFLLENLFMIFALAYLFYSFYKNKETFLSKSIVEALEVERESIGMNLHDELGGNLATLKRKIEDFFNRDENTKEEELSIINIAEKTIYDLRNISHNLFPPDFQNIGLINSIEYLCESFNSEDLKVYFSVNGNYKKKSNETELNIFRIVNELVHNVKKHACASEVEVQLNFNEKDLNIIVSDNGKWKESSRLGVGLRNIDLRVKFIEGIINFDKGHTGTTVILELKSNENKNVNY